MLPSFLLSLLLLHFPLSAWSAQTSPNDPFRAISIHARKSPENPICCLKPLPSPEPQSIEDELLLSFEDWKAKLLAEQQNKGNDNDTVSLSSGGKDSVNGGNGVNGSSDASTVPRSPLATLSVGAPSLLQDQPDELSPHFRVPLTDRFNYANLDCSARVHMAHRSAKSTSSILSSKKDRYMLSPCSTRSSDGKVEENHFVVVELCDDIRIDTVQLANFEFFSGVFKDLAVSVAKTYTTEPEGWINAGTYRAKNIRGVQSFHPPTALRDFYRYIRIDFYSHYGNEYYCPVSLLRVFGLTHLEEWKWDMWEAESRAKRIGILSSSADPSPTMADGNSESLILASNEREMPDSNDEESERSIATVSTTSMEIPHPSDTQLRHNGDTWTSSEEVLDHSSTSLTPSMLNASVSRVAALLHTEDHVAMESSHDTTTTMSARRSPSIRSQSRSKITTSSDPSPTLAKSLCVSPRSTVEQPQPSVDHTFSIASDAPSVLTPPSSTTLSSLSGTTPTTSILSAPHASPSGGGESIYRIIMNRLTTLELNTTLHTRYVGEHTAGVREALRRLGEDVGRLEGIGRAQALTYQRSLLEMERHRRRLELEYGELMSRVNYLAEEVVMEKRLGIAQLCILVAVLIFMTLTRGSRGELIGQRPMISQRLSRGTSWGQRTLSFSGDWVSRFRSRSPTPRSSSVDLHYTNDEVSFPAYHGSGTQTGDPQVNRLSTPVSTSTGFRRTAARARTSQSHPPSRYVSKQSTPTAAHSSSSVSFRPVLSRTDSQGHNPSALIGPMSKSTKKWARSAHIHEVKTSNSDHRAASKRSRSEDRKSPSLVDFSSKITVNEDWRREGRLPPPLRTYPESPISTEGNNTSTESELDAWVDTDDTSSEPDFVQESVSHHHELGQEQQDGGSSMALVAIKS